MTANRPAVPWLVAALVVLVLLAGCSGLGSSPSTGDSTPAGSPTESVPTETPTATDSPQDEPTPDTPAPADTPTSTATPAPAETPTPSDAEDGEGSNSEYSIPVNGNGSLDFDANVTYARTLELLGVSVSPPSQIYLENRDSPWQPVVSDAFAQTLIDGPTPSDGTPTFRDGVVIGLTGNESAREVQFTLVHEYVHKAQFTHAEGTTTDELVLGTGGGHRADAAFAIWEGSASYVAAEYMRRHTNLTEAEIDALNDEYSASGPAGKRYWAPYHFGQRYTQQRLDSPSELWQFYENPPRTTEELIHGLAPGSEPPANLSVSLDADGQIVTTRETRGELFIRSVLAAELSEQRAATGAAGWGNDRLLDIRADDGPGYAWVSRWDGSANATEFREQFQAAMNNRTEPTGDLWIVGEQAVTVQQVAPETVAVFTGPESFVGRATASGTNSTVSVGVTDT